MNRYCVILTATPNPLHHPELRKVPEERNVMVECDCEETARICATYCVLHEGWKVNDIKEVARVH